MLFKRTACPLLFTCFLVACTTPGSNPPSSMPGKTNRQSASIENTQQANEKCLGTMLSTCPDTALAQKTEVTFPAAANADSFQTSPVTGGTAGKAQHKLDQALRDIPPPGPATMARLYADAGSAQHLNGDDRAAIPLLQRALSYPVNALGQEQRVRTVMTLAEAYLRTGRYTEAIALLDGYAIPAGYDPNPSVDGLLAEAWLQRILQARGKSAPDSPAWAAKRWKAVQSMAAANDAVSLQAPVSKKGNKTTCVLPTRRSPGLRPVREGGKATVAVYMAPSGISRAPPGIIESSNNPRVDAFLLRMASRIQCKPYREAFQFLLPMGWQPGRR